MCGPGIQILEKRRLDSAQAHSDPEAARHLLEQDEKELRDFDFLWAPSGRTLSAKTQETCEHEWMKVRNGWKEGPKGFSVIRPSP